MKEQEDEWYITQIQNGNEKALEFLFRKYYYSLCHFAKAFVKSTDLADEAVTDVFLNIWQKRETLQIHGNFKAYLFISVKNMSTNKLVQGRTFFDNIDSAIHIEDFSTMCGERCITSSETIRQIEAIINLLPPQRKLIFTLNRLEGFRYKEIADILKISVSTVQKQMAEAVKYLSQYKSQFMFIGISCLVLLTHFLFL